MELSDPKIKKILIFYLKKDSRIFREMEPFNKTSCISEGNFLRLKNKKSYSRKTNVLNFRKWNFLASSLKILQVLKNKNFKYFEITANFACWKNFSK